MAKRLLFTMLVVTALVGCAVYNPAPKPYGYLVNALGQAVRVVTPMYVEPYDPAPPYYNQPSYVGLPDGKQEK